MAVVSLLVSVLVFIPLCALARVNPETVGYIHWLSPWIETSLRYSEPRRGDFRLTGALLGGRWEDVVEIGSRFEAQIAMGTRSLIARPLRYAALSSNETETDVTLVDVFAGVEGDWGHWRIGLIPLRFGLEEGDEPVRDWSRPLVIRNGILAQRDLGISYSVDSGGFESYWMVHNGEAGADRDREIWATARLEYSVRSSRTQFRIGASGQVGRTALESTHPTGTTSSTVELDPDQSSRIRYGGLHWRSDWEIGEGERGKESGRRLTIEAEGIAGEIQQDRQSRRPRSARFDLSYEPWNRTGFFGRYDSWDPDAQASGDLTQEMSVGAQFFLLRGDFKRSIRLLLIGTKEMLENRNFDNHRVELLFRFSPES